MDRAVLIHTPISTPQPLELFGYIITYTGSIQSNGPGPGGKPDKTCDGALSIKSYILRTYKYGIVKHFLRLAIMSFSFVYLFCSQTFTLGLLSVPLPSYSMRVSETALN